MKCAMKKRIHLRPLEQSSERVELSYFGPDVHTHSHTCNRREVYQSSS